MAFLCSYRKLFFITVLCAVIAVLPTAWADDVEQSTTLEPIKPVTDTKEYVRSKRWSILSDLASARLGTNWCLDQIINSDSTTGTGKYFQTDKCCKKLVKCTNIEKEALLNDYIVRPSWIDTITFRSCVCDEEFADCLHNVEWITCKAKKVGDYYFSILARKCVNEYGQLERNPRFHLRASKIGCLFE